MEADTIEADFITNDLTPDAFPASGSMDGGSVAKRGTLDESILKTFKRDIGDINSRLKQVVYPNFLIKRLDGSEQDFTNASIHCDLWAPLTFIILYAVSVSPAHAKTLFSSLFVSQWFVLLVMATHLRLTKPQAKTSLISYVSVSGYCLFPQVVNAVISRLLLPLILKVAHNSSWCIRALVLLRMLLMGICLFWSVSSISFVTKSNNFIEVYPLALCFFGIGWLTVIL
ncbi:hypothetical protein ZYGR_0AD05830 [Zygosaccharomyces rouxii]|uniref:ZYRO0G19448p n=2 Tax=Zygosaccharomyces rouxii TaxID=4956 RepID=C5E1A9_ZYGRC|nr:uncharacterized protein ZYRO0G19448g [Zygosaccharomyces rouxii]KAH9202886.1 hypothetical protein LQ764DRAFT_222995 [Zygosaccharomyces rouxii]GAV51400.1 hypothetical protein ZYGR_0AD05830 [Zygosaccharomyces rouxii]CAR29893.1 ZYRO0G19448p [Zygosaccharomyces rouxii]